MPSTIADELACNPFLHAHRPAVQRLTGTEDPVEGMRRIRALKDRFGKTGVVAKY